MKKIIAILDDEPIRIEAMCQQIIQRFTNLEHKTFDNAPDMIQWLKDSLEDVVVMSLDHDLGPNRERSGEVFDPGIGRDVVNFIESHKPTCPIIVHTTNHFGGEGMQYALEDAGWKVERIVPSSELTWITGRWINVVTELIEY